MSEKVLEKDNTVSYDSSNLQDESSLVHALLPPAKPDTTDDIPPKKELTLIQCVLKLLLNSIPNILNYMANFVRLSTNIHFLSKSGNIAWIAGAGLGHSWLHTTSGFVNTSLNLGTLLLSAPAYGAKNYDLVGVNFHKALILRFLMIIPSYALFWLSFSIFTVFGVDEDVAEEAHIYLVYSLPSVIFAAVFITTNIFLVTHKVYPPVLIIQLIMTGANWGWSWLFIEYMELGVKGAAFTLAGTNLIGAILSLGCAYFHKSFKHTLFCFRKESFQGLLSHLKKEFFLGAPYYLEWLAYEVFTLICGAYGSVQLGAWVIMYNLMSIIYMIPFGFSICVSQQIGNSLGDRNLSQAKKFMKAALYIALVWVALDVLVVYFYRRSLIGIFDSSELMYDVTEPLLITYAAVMPADFFQVTVMSFLKSLGKEKTATMVFSVSYYAIGVVVGFVLGSVYKMWSQGIMYGLAGGCYMLLLFSIVMFLRVNLKEQAEKIAKRAH